MNKFTIAMILFLGGCSPEVKLKTDQKATNTDKRFYIHSPPQLRKLEVVIIDNCEYLYGYVGGNGGYVLCHKGNCNNPIHVYNKENENDKCPFAGKCLLVPKKPIGHWYAIKVSENKFLIYSSRFSFGGPEREILKFHDWNGEQCWEDFAPLIEVKRLEPTIVNFNGFASE